MLFVSGTILVSGRVIDDDDDDDDADVLWFGELNTNLWFAVLVQCATGYIYMYIYIYDIFMFEESPQNFCQLNMYAHNSHTLPGCPFWGI